MGDPQFVRRVALDGRPGAYLRVLRDGEKAAADRIDVVVRPARGVTSALMSRALLRERELMATAMRARELRADLRAWMEERAGTRGA